MKNQSTVETETRGRQLCSNAGFGIIVDNLKTRFWAWRLRRIKRITGTIGFHPYPPDTETGWRKDRKDYLGIKATSRLVR